MEPYRGLQPYTEEYEKFFFGREAEKAILIDKILADKLTLLFASTGVGKSSLLQAAVMPELKRPVPQNLDVVYYNDWVTPPLEGLPQAVLDVLKQRGKVAEDFVPQTSPFAPSCLIRQPQAEAVDSTSLQEFLHICATFASEPLVIILDQFEEFFQYQRYSKHFKPFVVQLAEALKDKDTQVAFLISMREDFALELNAFKPYMPALLFENYYRLEKLRVDAAKEAIAEPVKQVGFRYEEGLLDTLLNDLAEQEREGRIGAQKASTAGDVPKFVEAPNVQIVCTQLWEQEKANPGCVIRTATYQRHKGAKGFIGNYFTRVITGFTLSEKKIASKAFDHLVTPRGTKMAYPVKDLSDKLRENEAELGKVLSKLERARVLRSQKRKDELWYELYHDMFSGIIYTWNSDYKARQRTRKSLIGTAIAVMAILLVLLAVDVYTNYTSHHLRLSSKAGISTQIEVYRGKAGTWDVAGLQGYEAETAYTRNQVEPDKWFSHKAIAEYEKLNSELIDYLPAVGRIAAYWNAGTIDTALELAQKSIVREDMTRSRTVIDLLASFRSQRVFDEIFKTQLTDVEESYTIRTRIISAIHGTRFLEVVETLNVLLTDQSTTVRSNAALALGQIGDPWAVEGLLTVLADEDSAVREKAAGALGQIGDPRAVDGLLAALADENHTVRYYAAWALGQIGDAQAVDGLLTALADEDRAVRQYAAGALGQIGDPRAVDELLTALRDEERAIRRKAAEALVEIGDARAVKGLLTALHDEKHTVRFYAAWALGQIGDARAVDGLLTALAGDDSTVRFYAAGALGQIGDPRAMDGLLTALANEDRAVREKAAGALGQIGDPRAMNGLLTALPDENHTVRRNAAGALGQIGDPRAVDGLLAALADENLAVRYYAAWALGQIGDAQAVGGLLTALRDEDSDVQKIVARALGQIGDAQAVNGLLTALANEDSDVRYYAAWALGQNGDARAVDELLSALRNEERDVRQNAAEALGQIGDARTVEGLLTALADEDSTVRQKAAEALGQIGDAGAIDKLLSALHDEDSAVRGSVAEALGQIGNPGAVEGLLTALSDGDSAVRRNAAEALGQIGSASAIQLLLRRLKDSDTVLSTVLALGQLSVPEAIEPLKEIYAKETSQLEIAAILLRLGQNDGLALLQEESRNESVYARRKVAAIFGDAYSKEGSTILLDMLDDEDLGVRRQVIESLGYSHNPAMVPRLQPFLDSEYSLLRNAAVHAILGIAAPESIPFFRQTALDSRAKAPLRIAAIKALGKTGAEEAITILLEMLGNVEYEFYHPAAIMALGNTRSRHALKPLQKYLEIQEDRREEWRDIRDENIDDYTDEQLEDWRERLQKVEPQTHLEFHLAYAIAQIDPQNAGFNLLSHDLANVREGAWLGLAKLPLTNTKPYYMQDAAGAVEFLQRLYNERESSNNPLFRHAAYRAIDNILITLEVYGDTTTQADLETFEGHVQDMDKAVKTRVEWTIARLAEHFGG